MITVFEYAFGGAITLLGLIVGLFLTLYPKVRNYIDKEESKFREEYMKSFIQIIFDLSKAHPSVYDEKRGQWLSGVPTVQEVQKFLTNAFKSADKFWDDVKQARKLRDRLDMVIISFIIGVICFFITPLLPTQILSTLILAIGISASVVGLVILFFVIKRLY